MLQLIADFTDLNLVASDTVSGKITLRLKNVPWDQALELILKTKGLDKRQVGNVLLVAPAAEIAAREKQELENQKQISELAPLRTEFIQIRYASASQLFQLFNSAARGSAGSSGGAGSSSSSSSRPERHAVRSWHRDCRRTDQCDHHYRYGGPHRRVPQGDRAARHRRSAGADRSPHRDRQHELLRAVGYPVGRRHYSNGGKYQTGGSLETVNEIRDGSVGGTSPGNLAVDLGAAGAATSFALGITGESYLLDLELSALATEGNAEVVARPKVITADKSPATIRSGTEVPYQEALSYLSPGMTMLLNFLRVALVAILALLMFGVAEKFRPRFISKAGRGKGPTTPLLLCFLVLPLLLFPRQRFMPNFPVRHY